MTAITAQQLADEQRSRLREAARNRRDNPSVQTMDALNREIFLAMRSVPRLLGPNEIAHLVQLSRQRVYQITQEH